MNEQYSYRTAVTRNRPSVPMRWLTDTKCIRVKGGLDYGCGKGFDADYHGMAKYDPHFCPQRPKGRFSLITCIYVLNVVSAETGRRVMRDIRSLLTADGVAYLVWRNDLRRNTDSQRMVTMDTDHVIRTRRPFCVATMKKHDVINLT